MKVNDRREEQRKDTYQHHAPAYVFFLLATTRGLENAETVYACYIAPGASRTSVGKYECDELNTAIQCLSRSRRKRGGPEVRCEGSCRGKTGMGELGFSVTER